MVDRVPSAIPGFDRLTKGGFVGGSVNLITGKVGTGKSIFTSQFIYKGYSDYGDNGLLIVSEENSKSLKREMNAFGWDFNSIPDDKLRVIDVEPYNSKRIMTTISQGLEEVNPKRLVIDSVSIFEISLADHYKIRKFLFSLFQKLRDHGIVALITSEVPEDSDRFSRFGAVEFMSDSITKLQYMELADQKRSLLIRKMRMTDHSPDIHPFKISSEGIKILKV